VSDAASTTARETSEKRGPVLEVLRELLTERRDSEVLALVSKLMVRNSELERRLMQMLSRGHKNEGVSTALLRLFLDALAATGVDVGDAGAPDLGDADDKLRGASGIDAATESAAEKPAKQPPLRKPPSAKLPRIDNPIAVPAAERPCPVCGAERTCIGHDVTEVIELEPARVVVRVDRREKLAFGRCDGELARAPVGDKVVSGGRLGSTLVAVLVVDKYDDGLPLHRQKRRFERMGARPGRVDARRSGHVGDGPHAPAVADGHRASARGDGDAPGCDGAAGARSRREWRQAARRAVGLCRRRERGGVSVRVYGKEERTAPWRARPRRDAGAANGLHGGRRIEPFDSSFERTDLIECGCNMHGRRYWTKALDAGDTRAALPIAAYKKLDEIEAKIRGLAPGDKLSVRQEESKRSLTRSCRGLKRTSRTSRRHQGSARRSGT
jgi:transposase